MDNLSPKKHLFILTFLISSLVIINVMGWQHMTAMTERYYDLINISGKQRMLTQRIAYYATKTELDEGDLIQLQSALDLIKHNHRSFIDGNVEYNINKPKKGDEAYELYFGAARLDRGIHQLIKSVQTYVESKGTERPFNLNSTIPNQLLSKTNLAVEHYLRQAKEKTQMAFNWLVLVNFILLIAVLIQVTQAYRRLLPVLQDAEANADDKNDLIASGSNVVQNANAASSAVTIATPVSADTLSATQNVSIESVTADTQLSETCTSDQPHVLEFRHILWVGVEPTGLDALKAALNCIVGLKQTHCDDEAQALTHLQNCEANRRPVDIIIAANQAQFAQLEQQIQQADLHQSYCVLHLENPNRSPSRGAVPFAADYPLNAAMTHITDAFAPFKKINEDVELDFSHKRVLLVDDNKINLMVLEGMVQKTKVQVEVAHDGIEALALANERKFDLIFMDLQMPNMNGYDATEKIMADTLNRNTPVVAITANHDYQDRCRCQKIGMLGCEAKPVHHGEIAKILQHFLD